MGGGTLNPIQMTQNPYIRGDTSNPNQMNQHSHLGGDILNPKTLNQMTHQKLPTLQGGGGHFKPPYLETDNLVEALHKEPIKHLMKWMRCSSSCRRHKPTYPYGVYLWPYTSIARIQQTFLIKSKSLQPLLLKI